MGNHIIPALIVECKNATTACRIALRGKVLAAHWDCSVANISNAEKHGHGAIKQVCDTLLDLRDSLLFDGLHMEVEDAIRKTMTVIAKSCGYIAFKPIPHHDVPVQDILEAAQLTMEEASAIIARLTEAISPNGDKGKEISEKEKRRIKGSLEHAINKLFAIKDMVDEI